MRSHVTGQPLAQAAGIITFQYRKRYEITCDRISKEQLRKSELFQYRKRYEITCDSNEPDCAQVEAKGFNTASGMRSHVTMAPLRHRVLAKEFQYRKRYEITCDRCCSWCGRLLCLRFNTASGMRSHVTDETEITAEVGKGSFNTASGMRSHVTRL